MSNDSRDDPPCASAGAESESKDRRAVCCHVFFGNGCGRSMLRIEIWDFASDTTNPNLDMSSAFNLAGCKLAGHTLSR